MKNLYNRKILRTSIAGSERFVLSGDNRFGLVARSYIMISYDRDILKLELPVRPAARI